MNDYIVNHMHRVTGKKGFSFVQRVPEGGDPCQVYHDDFDYGEKTIVSSVIKVMRDTSRLPYEVHFTVDAPSLPEFEVICKIVGVKPLLIALQSKSMENKIIDVMTKWHSVCSIDEVFQKASLMKEKFEAEGCAVKRTKIESVPWHPMSPKFDDEEIVAVANGQYFECNAQFELSGEARVVNRFRELATRSSVIHLSKNPFKILDNGGYVQMITLRGVAPMFTFRKVCEGALDMFKSHGFMAKKVEHEFCVYDSNQKHDDVWIKN